jgi:hypothetical protein
VTLRAARGADVLWTVPDGDWGVSGNWSNDAGPGPADAALLNLAGGGGVTPTAHVTTDVGTVAAVSVANDNRLSMETGGALAVNGGSNPAAGVRIGDGSGGVANLGGTGRLTTTVNDVGGDVRVGIGDGGRGTLNLADTAQLSPRNLVVGDAGGTGVVNHARGTVTLGGPGFGRLVLGRNAGSTGTYNLSGGTLNVVNRATDPGFTEFSVGFDGGSGRFVVTGGAVEVTGAPGGALGNFVVGHGPGSTGSFEISGGSLHANGAFIMAGRDLALPETSDMSGTATQTGGVVTGDKWVSIAETGTGTYNLSGGQLMAPRDLNISDLDNSHGTLNLSDSGYAFAKGLYIAKSPGGVGVINQTGGTMVANGVVFADNKTATGTYNLRGGVLDLQGGGITRGAGTLAFNMTGGELRNPTTLGIPFDQEGGALFVGDKDGVGWTTLGGNYTLGPNAILDIAMNGPTDYDYLRVLDSGLVITLHGRLALHLNFAPTPGQQFVIISNTFGRSQVVGNFDGLPEGSVFDTANARFRINYASGVLGHDVVLTALATPEPGTLGVLGVAAVALVGVRRRRRPRADSEPCKKAWHGFR